MKNHILLDILRSNSGLILKHDLLIECYIKDFVNEKLCRKCSLEGSSRPMFNCSK